MTGARSEAWSTFFAGSLVLVGHTDSPQPVIAYYHPLYDAVLITRWMPKGDTPEMTAADLRVASLFDKKKGRESPARALWLEEMVKTSVPEVLGGQYARFLKVFEKKFPSEATSLAKVTPSGNVGKTVAFVETQASDALRNMLAVQRARSPLYNARLKELRTALAKYDKNALAKLIPQNNPTSLKAILEIPKERAGHFVPCYAVLSQANSMVILQDTVFPRYYMLVFFRHNKDKIQTNTDITSLFFFELEQSYP